MIEIDETAVTASTATPTEYVFPNAWGGATRSPNPPQVHAKQRELRLAIGGVAAKKQAGGPMFPVRGAKELVQKAAQAVTDADCTISLIGQDITHIETDKIPGNSTSSGKPVFRTLTHVKATVRLTAPDGSFVDWVGSGHGGDVDDKAGGKASTYAFKDAIFKGLMIPDADIVDTDDETSESREAKQPKGASKASKAEAAGAANPGPEGQGGDLDKVLAALSACKTMDALNTVAAEIKAGKWNVEGPDRLRAMTRYTEVKKEIQSAG